MRRPFAWANNLKGLAAIVVGVEEESGAPACSCAGHAGSSGLLEGMLVQRVLRGCGGGWDAWEEHMELGPPRPGPIIRGTAECELPGYLWCIINK